jgi:hypothetical protein
MKQPNAPPRLIRLVMLFVWYRLPGFAGAIRPLPCAFVLKIITGNHSNEKEIRQGTQAFAILAANQ